MCHGFLAETSENGVNTLTPLIMVGEIVLYSCEADDGSQSLHVRSGNAGPDQSLSSPIPAAVVHRSSVLDSALCNASGPIPLPICASDFYLWLDRSAESIEDMCKALKVMRWDSTLPR